MNCEFRRMARRNHRNRIKYVQNNRTSKGRKKNQWMYGQLEAALMSHITDLYKEQRGSSESG